jgi:hypothetical protein
MKRLVTAAVVWSSSSLRSSRLLLVQEAIDDWSVGRWCLPGEWVKHDEAPADAFARLCKTKLSIDKRVRAADLVLTAQNNNGNEFEVSCFTVRFQSYRHPLVHTPKCYYGFGWFDFLALQCLADGDLLTPLGISALPHLLPLSPTR